VVTQSPEEGIAIFVKGFDPLHTDSSHSPPPPPMDIWVVRPKDRVRRRPAPPSSPSRAASASLSAAGASTAAAAATAATAAKPALGARAAQRLTEHSHWAKWRKRAPTKMPPIEPSPPPPPSSNGASRGGGRARAEEKATSSLALHRSARKWLEGCVNASSLETALPSSEYWRERRSFRFYKHLLCIIQRYAHAAKSALDVGSSLPPFLNALPWIQQKAIVGPRFAGNVGKGGKEILSLPRIEAKFGVTAHQADFLAWQPERGGATTPGPLYDLIICSEVVEHVEQPSAFVRKLLALGRVVVLSVPYMWEACDNTQCHHKTHKITRQRIEAWAGRSPQAFDIVEEASGDRRIICVYDYRAQAEPGAMTAPHARTEDEMHLAY
jgi:hypothetical protein